MPRTTVFVSRVPKKCPHDARDWHLDYLARNPNKIMGFEDALVRSGEGSYTWRNLMRLKGTEYDLTDKLDEWPEQYAVTRCTRCDNERIRQWNAMHWERSPWVRRQRCVYALAALETESTLTAENRQEVLDILRQFHITNGDFWAMDDRPSDYGYPQHGMTITLQDVGGKREWHWKLRQVRNSAGAPLFDVLKQNEADGYADDDTIPAIPLFRYNDPDWQE